VVDQGGTKGPWKECHPLGRGRIERATTAYKLLSYNTVEIYTAQPFIETARMSVKLKALIVAAAGVGKKRRRDDAVPDEERSERFGAEAAMTHQRVPVPTS
jgi:hypothetical protein